MLYYFHHELFPRSQPSIEETLKKSNTKFKKKKHNSGNYV